MTIRMMEAGDLDQVAAIEAGVFSTPWSKKGFEDTLSMDNVIFYVAEESGRILGYAGMYLAADEGEITNVAVNPADRRQGIANEIMNAILQCARERELAFLILEVRCKNDAAIHLYRKFGFYEIGVRKNFYREPVEDALVMRTDL